VVKYSRSNSIRESVLDNLRDSIKEILFEIGKSIKVHKIDNDNSVIELDYDKYAEEIALLLTRQKDLKDPGHS
jgi:predicted house-cleaning noncanonical NTP pyrophosphatase (MazG superfamily)